MSHVLHRSLVQSYPVAVKGEGVYLIDSTGKRYLDACGGAAVSCLGHSDPAVIAAIQRQVAELAYAHSAFFTSEPMEQLANFLTARAPGSLDYVYFVSGGSEAIESALKLARQYYVEKGEPERRHIISRRQSYHGNTLGALATGGNLWRRSQFEPLLVETHQVSPCYAYREMRPGETEAVFARRLADELESKILELGADQVMAFIAEPVVGATLGAVPPVADYFRLIRRVCDRYGVLLIADEVMCGMGRTGSLFVSAQEQIEPDILCIAKGLGAGYQPIGATLVSEQIVRTLREGSGFFQHGHTYIGHATACAAALAVQQQIESRQLLSQVVSMGRKLHAGLQSQLGDLPYIGDIRGRGLFRGIELVRDRDSRTPFSPELKLHARIKAKAMELGLMCYPMGGTVNGRDGDHILLAPPFIIDDGHVDQIVDRLSASIQHVMRGI
ncbi:aspartate aminotransferase family protein [Pseudomonas sp. gcc21]|uniref:aspartate aminotransferase family protein n=1 Tax=Pseudomonas sp. gcc21 TaxID=2726989 RepID=UPI0014518E9F|nr:aspartate aminotransferase family protein [Pseudomonas sp. gcc21]QJD57717.1 aspartate aminotransferase family protein [Pseudomonas sp. gcc21]